MKINNENTGINNVKLLMVSFFIMVFSGCTTGNYVAGGAVAGGAIGSVVGSQHGVTHGAQGALIGAAVGALAGGIIASEEQRESAVYPKARETLIVICPTCESRIDVSDFPNHSTVACPNCSTHFTY
ncbi:MAG: hypothetical protein ACD_79C01243G0006 [uncultured bacterium]|nr:MAG: hypothetical protein ACD_79C01243G0006 [uncultured bacterium]